ncbi:helix-turn-helix domain-containing protein [Nocardiopsis sp. RSe5-2]|uniref:Helix-turn-helix domain-containing protein n=1 Tax=Nocardiopsis endophytica TaxID=3018445 RepID=A0ABT4UCL6_9ACTN|nr:helix-turn-helix domain-containing protein [Nocardiopsis endophytica]MDA2814642.1 helix-turn-helix domain-containing protein [Nocardiopsis endophytica]
MSTIGRILAAARDRAGYSIQELSARTYIRESVLEGIERDDFGPCGGDFYARGHIKAVCRELEIEPAELIERFDAEYATGPTSPLMGGDGAWPVAPERSGAEGGGGDVRSTGPGSGAGAGAGPGAGRGGGSKDGKDGRDGKAKGRDRRRPGGVLRPFRGPAGGGPREPDGGPAERPPAVDEGVVVTGPGSVPERPPSSGDEPEDEVPPQERGASAGAAEEDTERREDERAARAGEPARGAADDADAGHEVGRPAASRHEPRGPRARSDKRVRGERRPVRRPPAGPPEDEFDEELDDAPWRRRWGTAAGAGAGAAVADDGADESATGGGAADDGASEGVVIGGAAPAGAGGRAGRGWGAEPGGPDDDEEAESAAAPSAVAVLADRARRHWPVAVALGLAAAAVIAGIQAWPDDGGDRASGSGAVAEEAEAGAAEAAERDDAMAEKRSRREAATQAQPAMSTTVRNGKRPDEVRIRVYALHRTWLSVTDGDGERVFAGAVKKGSTHIWSDRDELRFHVGNAGGVHLEVNGVEEGVPGGRGQVKYLTFSADDLAE